MARTRAVGRQRWPRRLLVALGALLLLGVVAMGVQTVRLTQELDQRVAITQDLADGNVRTLGQVQRELLRLEALLVAPEVDVDAVDLQSSLTAQRVQEGTLSFQRKSLGSNSLLTRSRTLAQRWTQDVRPLVGPAATAAPGSPERDRAVAAIDRLELGYNQLVSDGEIQRKVRAAASNDTVGDLVVGSRRLLLRLLATSVLFLGFLLATTLSLRRLDRQRAKDAAELRATSEELRKHAFVVQSTDNMVVITDAEGCIEWVNDAFERVTGWTLPEVAGQRPGRVLQGPETDPATVARMHDHVEAGEGFTCELVNYSREGRAYWVSLEATPVRDDRGEVTGYVAVETDVTERRDTEQLLRTAKESAEESAREKAAFLASMSHEIRTPLNSVLGLTDMLQLTDLDEEQRGYVDTARHSGQLLLSLINDILDFSALESGQTEPEARTFAPRTLVSDCLAMFEPEVRSRSLALISEIDARVPQALCGDETGLRQVLVNLVANALKFTHEGAVRVQVSTAPGDDTRLVLRVVDTGIGIAADRIDRLFQPFSQGDSSTTRQYGGTGLGLAICRLLTDRMGGTISLTSTPGEGSAFTVEAPLSAADPADLPQAADPQDLELGPLRVLLAEDDSVNQKVMSAMLRRLGTEPVLAGDGAAAIEAVDDAAASGRPFDVVLMDVHMPVMDGMEAVGVLATRPGPRPLVIAVTANALPGDRERLLAHGFDGYQSKPIRLAELADTLHRAAGERERRDASRVETSSGLPTAQDAPPVDEAAFAERLGAPDPVLLAEVVAGLLEQAQGVLRLLPQDGAGVTSLPPDRAAMLHEAAHTLKGAAAACDAAPLSSAAADLEDIAAGRRAGGVGFLGQQLERESGRLAAWLQQHQSAAAG